MRMFFLMNLAAVYCCTGLFAADNTLTEAEKQDGWVLLFNGKDFSGWRIDKWNPKSFSIEDGAIKCHGKPSMIYYDGEGKEMKDFHFVADVMTQPGANGGIFFHTKYQDKGWPIGHEAQIDMTHTDPVRTGSIYIVRKNLEAPAKDNEWFKYEIIVRGATIETKVDGKTVVSYEESPDVKGTRKLSSGTIGIQAHDPGSVVLIKSIKVKPLSQ
ncbi:MAG: DUF1080 domain-containing protein [Planctomycetes bacterium]|nr:DUF1080 domain-containing protein [Planctomycetota bacterium]MBL7039633.1 DUF1080 domain-containing protein [Pirellulaceae bacterium]